MNQTLRRILEWVGMMESRHDILRRRVMEISRNLPQGKASLIVRSVGGKQNSALSTMRNVTDLELGEVVDLLNVLPAPLLIHVSAETAVAAKQKLDRLGVQTEIIGLSAKQQEDAQPEKTPTKEGASPRQQRPFSLQPGNYRVTLTTVGLLGERVLDGVQRIMGRSMPSVAALEETLPLVLLRGVDQETAVKAQTLLQMVGAVVDIDEQVAEVAEGQDALADALDYALWLSEVGTDRVGVVRTLADILQTDMLQATAVADSAPGYILQNVSADQVLQALEKLEAFGAEVEILEPEQP